MLGLNEAGRKAFATMVVCGVLSILAVGLRLFVKLKHKTGVSWDDYWIIIALVFGLGAQAVVQWGVCTAGGGLEVAELFALSKKDPKGKEWLDRYVMAIFVGFTSYLTMMLFLKLSILSFYRRIFFIKKSYQYASIVLIIATVIWYLVSQLLRFFACTPVDAQWNRSKPGKCMNNNVIFLSSGLVETAIDLVVLFLPVRVAFKLHLPKSTKVAVGAIFALGGFAIITNILRLRHVFNPHTKLVKYSNAEKWSNIHAVTAIICACMPIYKPLWNSFSSTAGTYLSRYTVSLRSRFGTSSSGTKDESYGQKSQEQKSYDRKSYAQMGNVENASGSFKSLNFETSALEAMDRVHVKDEASMSFVEYQSATALPTYGIQNSEKPYPRGGDMV